MEEMLLASFIGSIFSIIGWLIIVIHLANTSENTKFLYNSLIRIEDLLNNTIKKEK